MRNRLQFLGFMQQIPTNGHLTTWPDLRETNPPRKWTRPVVGQSEDVDVRKISQTFQKPESSNPVPKRALPSSSSIDPSSGR